MTFRYQDFIERVLFPSPNNLAQEGETIAGSVTGDGLIDICLREDIAPALYYLLKINGRTGVLPPADLQALARLFERNLTSNLILRQELLAVLGRFNAEGLSHLLLKGMALAEFYYPSLSMRRMTDVDILVREEELFSIDTCLKEMGYIPVDSDIENSLGNPEGYLASMEYHRRAGLPPLHIHWRLVNTSVPAGMFSPFESVRHLWDQSVPVKLDGVASRMLCPEHLLLHLCEHALRVNHSFNRLILVYDIVQVLEHVENGLDWDGVMAEARSSHRDLFLYCSLAIVHHYKASAVPSDLLIRLRPPRLTWEQRLFLRLQLQGKRIRGSSYLVYLSLNRDLWSKWMFLCRTFVPPPAILRQRRRKGNSADTALLSVLRVWEIIRYLAGVMPRLFGKR